MTSLRHGLQSRLAEAKLAMMLLTRFPVGHIKDPAPSAAAACWAFPLAGLAVGIATSVTMAGTLWLGLPHDIAAGLTLVVGVIATGGLHEDGLADVADGFGGGRTRERKLEIMRDSHIGSYGALALIFMIGLRWSAMTTLADRDPSGSFFGLVAIAILSRSVLPLVLAQLPPARQEGLGHSASNPGSLRPAVSVGFGILTSMYLLGYWATLAVSISAGVTVLLAGWWSLRQIGGQTGDVVGAIQQITDLFAWIVLLLISASD